MKNDFDAWNEIKKKVDNINNCDYFPKIGEVWMSTVGKNIGFEQNGSGENFSRPVLITKKFNNHMFWSVPLSTKQKSLDFYYNFTDIDNKEVSVILAQLKLTSVKRLRRKIYDLPRVNLLEIILRLKDMM